MAHSPSYPNGFISVWVAQKFPEGYEGWAIDVGASDGISISSTYVLEKQARWNVLCVEANPFFKKYLKSCRVRVEMCACADQPADEADFFVNEDRPESFSALKISSHDCVRSWTNPNPWTKERVRVETVDRLLTKWDFPRLDVLFVDVEGGEPEVLRGANLEKWRPKILVVENWDQGSTDSMLTPLGYKRTARSVDNDFYELQ